MQRIYIQFFLYINMHCVKNYIAIYCDILYKMYKHE